MLIHNYLRTSQVVFKYNNTFNFEGWPLEEIQKTIEEFLEDEDEATIFFTKGENTVVSSCIISKAYSKYKAHYFGWHSGSLDFYIIGEENLNVIFSKLQEYIVYDI